MALNIDAITLSDPPNFDEFALAQEIIGGYVQITGNAARLQLLYGMQGQQLRTEEMVVATGSYNVGRSPNGVPLTGIRAQNAVAGFGAVLSGYFWDIASPTLSFVGVASSQVAGSVVIPVVALADWPPSSPVDGTTVWLELPASFDPVGGRTIRWLCTYDAVANIWDVEGPDLHAEVNTAQARNNVAYGDLATVGPSLTIPVGGDYLVQVGYQLALDTNAVSPFMSYDVGATGALDADGAVLAQTFAAAAPALDGSPVSPSRLKTPSSSDTVVAKYRSQPAANITYSNRWMNISPRSITNAP